ncbi:hypothetical protein C9374_007411 [Naegleria lovaniensis]|uniref:Uncharacterized protein n=1 Tax=Naegleria lovaniensis TaxID=51637 RepID=A0AA88KGK2_NAELO|nr:uncharacterized protein C9374_007411 [Naegleria lovaniensis]KAG2379272.1 hypothetical protein C9374_007411 [Naegleria lovaniensis]
MLLRKSSLSSLLSCHHRCIKTTSSTTPLKSSLIHHDSVKLKLLFIENYSNGVAQAHAHFHHHSFIALNSSNNSSKILLKNTTVGTTPTKPLKFKASSSDPNNSSSKGDSKSKPKSNFFFNLTLGCSLAIFALMQYVNYHEDLDPDANNDDWKLLFSSLEGEQDPSNHTKVKYSVFTKRHHFKMNEFIAMSSNSYITQVQDEEGGENLIVLYNPIKLTEQTKQHLNSLFSPNLRNTFVIVLPNTEHTSFFGDYYHDYCYKEASKKHNARVLFLCQKDAKDMFIELARKNIVVRKETPVTAEINIESDLFMEFGRFSAVSKKETARDQRKEIVDLVTKHFEIIRVKGIDPRVEESLLYHKASKTLMACDLIMNLEGHTAQDPIIKLKRPQYEPYVLKYSRHFKFGKEMDAPYLDKNMLHDIPKIRESLNQAVRLPWNGVGMAHGNTIVIENTPEGRKREEELKQKWLSSWESKFTA